MTWNPALRAGRALAPGLASASSVACMTVFALPERARKLPAPTAPDQNLRGDSMRFGVGFQSHIERSWRHAVLAEELGFDHAWMVDSQLIASDVFACLALAAVNTRRISLGPGVTISETRIPPVIAHSIATINQLAPGRVILGLGSGHTAWRTMDMPPTPLTALRHTIEVCRGLLSGSSVAYTARGRTRQIRFLDVDHGYINVKDPIPIYVAASHPRARALAGELGDGLLSLSVLDPSVLAHELLDVEAGRALRKPGTAEEFTTVTLGICCLLQPGEALNSPRVLRRVGPRIAVALHYAFEQARQGKAVPTFLEPFLTPEYQTYLTHRWDSIHATHSRFLHAGEERFITPSVIQAMSLTGTRDDILERLHALEQAGLKQFVISPPWDFVEESIVEFGQEIARHHRGG